MNAPRDIKVSLRTTLVGVLCLILGISWWLDHRRRTDRIEHLQREIKRLDEESIQYGVWR